MGFIEVLGWIVVVFFCFLISPLAIAVAALTLWMIWALLLMIWTLISGVFSFFIDCIKDMFK